MRILGSLVKLVFSMVLGWCSTGFLLATNEVTFIRVSLIIVVAIFMYVSINDVFRNGMAELCGVCIVIAFGVGSILIAPWLADVCGIIKFKMAFMVIVGFFCANIAAWIISSWLQAEKMFNSTPPPLPPFK